jgi:uncharacterized protein YegJ (DUF2314 family)
MVRVVLRRILGLITFIMGVVLAAWFVYNQFHPTPEFQRSFRSVFQLALPAVFLIYGWRWLHYSGPGIEETPGTVAFPELTESVTQARNTLSYFIAQVEKNVDGAYVKFPLLTPGGITEHIWAYVHSYREGNFNVSLANVPKDPKEPAQGRRDIAKDQVEDWQILQSDGRIKGAFSTIALFRNRENTGKPLTPKMRKQKALFLDIAR